MKTKEIDIKEVVKRDIENIKKEMIGIKNVVFELNSLTMEIPFIDKVDQNVKKKLVEKMRVIYASASEIFEEVNKMDRILGRKEVKDYVKQLNVYLNALSTLEYSTHQYFAAFLNKYVPDDDINSIYTIYVNVTQMIYSFTENHKKIVGNLGEEYYA